ESDWQCVSYKDELLLCGGLGVKTCYSYHCKKNEWKKICDYPETIKELFGHCVIEWKNKDVSKQMRLLSFGGQNKNKSKHVLTMTYLSVWPKNSKDKDNGNDILNNSWTPVIHSNGKKLIIGKDTDNLRGAKGIIGGKKNNLLFVTYALTNIDVIDLNTFDCLAYKQLDYVMQKYSLSYNCF
ncbi:hypothetical protein RFI_22518, partial [Reticulomyxa filosa]